MLPVGTHANTFDTVHLDGLHSHYSASVAEIRAAAYLNEDTITVGTKGIACSHLIFTAHDYENIGFNSKAPYPDPNPNSGFIIGIEYWYSPMLHCIVKERQYNWASGDSIQGGTDQNADRPQAGISRVDKPARRDILTISGLAASHRMCFARDPLTTVTSPELPYTKRAGEI
ncbi:MAG: hypothetical protein JWQ98_1994 [Chlorobi bacterium]|nr:hypothetical protein [Chlorobiota bacterium]